MSSEKKEALLPKIVVSVPPYIYFVKKIAGDQIKVETLIPANTNPHIYEPTPSQISLATEANIWFIIGESFEKYLLPFLKKNNSKLTISDLRENIDLIPYENDKKCHGHLDFKDVHIWTSPRLAKIQARTICKTLSKRFPENRDLYEKNLATFLAELDLLNTYIEQKIAPFKGSSFLISHPSFSYFCKDYEINQISIEYEGKDPTLKKLSGIFQEAKEKNIKKVFVQAQYNNKGAEFIAKQMELTLKWVDPYSTNYEETLKKFVDMLISN
jgi:zinc transport system substrate-binding protein